MLYLCDILNPFTFVYLNDILILIFLLEEDPEGTPASIGELSMCKSGEMQVL